MIRHFAAGLCGLLFGLGLVISRMIDPARVLGFLDIAGFWDPTLAFVMAGALAVAIPTFQLARLAPRPLLSNAFHVPRRKDIDIDLVAGALLFGIGWGLVGLCPGPAVTGLALGRWEIALFVLAMLTGMIFQRWRPHLMATGDSRV